MQVSIPKLFPERLITPLEKFLLISKVPGKIESSGSELLAESLDGGARPPKRALPWDLTFPGK
jgi:hypothetical protein